MKNSLPGNLLARYPGVVVNVEDVGEKVKSIILRINMLEEPSPGQFLMVWIPGVEEIPLSPSLYRGDILRLTVAAVGPSSSRFHKLRAGDRVLVRGPYGRGFTLRYKRPLLIGGGYGIAPLVYLSYKYLEMGVKPEIVIGGRSRSNLYHLDELKKLRLKVYPCTEDGSLGFKGVVTEYLKNLDISTYDFVAACGPEKMLFNIYNYLREEGLLGTLDVEFSVERIIKCGIGICGSCSIGGYLVCVDGPVFKVEELECTEFGRWGRDESGGSVPIDS